MTLIAANTVTPPPFARLLDPYACLETPCRIGKAEVKAMLPPVRHRPGDTPHDFL